MSKPSELEASTSTPPQLALVLERQGRAPELYSNPVLVSRYQMVARAIQLAPKVVYYPCSGTDITPSVAFPNARVVYVETDSTVLKALAPKSSANFEVREESATTYETGEAIDLLILWNPTIPSDGPIHNVAPGGYVICNNYHSSADQLRENTDFEFVGVGRTDTSGGLYFDQENLEQYWETVENEDEFQRAPMTWGAVNHITAEQWVNKYQPGSEDVFTRYQHLLARARNQTREAVLQVTAADVALFGGDPDEETDDLIQVSAQPMDLKTDQEDTLWFSPPNEDRPIPLFTILPRKKGTADSVFVFRRRTLVQ